VHAFVYQTPTALPEAEADVQLAVPVNEIDAQLAVPEIASDAQVALNGAQILSVSLRLRQTPHPAVRLANSLAFPKLNPGDSLALVHLCHDPHDTVSYEYDSTTSF